MITSTPFISRFRAWWTALSLVSQFVVMSSAIILLSVVILERWVSVKIEESVKQHVGARAAVQMESFFAPALQELVLQQHLSPKSVDKIDRFLNNDKHNPHVINAKVWAQDGTILYATHKDLVGKKFPVPKQIIRAWEGQLEVHFYDDPKLQPDDASEIDHPSEFKGVNSVFEIYLPIRQVSTKRTIAVVELYEDAGILTSELRTSKFQSWAVSALVTLSILAILFRIVAQGSRTIHDQRTALTSQVVQFSSLLTQNENLRQRAHQASQRSAEDMELGLRRLGSDLHDGVGQLLALAILKLNQLTKGNKQHSKELKLVRGTLKDAMAEIRDISTGMVLPEIDELQLVDALKLIVSLHQRHTSTRIACIFPNEPIDVSHPVKLCLCRFVQEALSNAFQHAGGIGQAVKATWADQTIVIKVSDNGPGIVPVKTPTDRQPLGLIGLKNRLESLGGQLTVHSKAGEGTTIVASLPIMG